MALNPTAVLHTEDELTRRILINEQRRATILAIVLALMAAVIGLHILTIDERHLSAPVYRWVLLSTTFAAVYEFAVSRLFVHLIKKGKEPPHYRLYLNATLELALPTLTAFIAAKYIPASHAITGLATYPYFLIILLSTLRLDFRLSLFTGIVACCGFSLLCLLHWGELEEQWGGPYSGIHFGLFMRALMYLVFGVVAAIVTKGIRHNLVETMTTIKERERVKQIFGQHLSPVVVNQLLTQSQTISEMRDVCVMVLDIRNFTAYSEDRPPEEVVAHLNRLWGFMVHTVHAHQGFLSKFLGDGFMAVFGAPVSSGIDCKNALAAGLQILKELEELGASGKLPATQVGIALHAGRTIVGVIGSEEKREYTVIGDVVNVTFRIEALNKKFGTKLLISEPVRESAECTDGEKMEPITIRGRHEPVQLYKIA